MSAVGQQHGHVRNALAAVRDTVTGASVVDMRLAALRRFAIGITLVTVIGHAYLGFEMAYAHPFVALATGYALDLGLEWIGARLNGRSPAFAGNGIVGVVNFLLPAHITSLACAMLIYSNETYWPLVFCVAAAVGSKYIFRVSVGDGRTRHFLNPSNAGIAATLTVFPWIGVAPPYQFTNNVGGAWDWILPALLIAIGVRLNWRFTKKLPLLSGWLLGFVLQAVVRGLSPEFSLLHALSPLTGVAFWLFTFYMITDPGTTPFRPRNQFVFGFLVAIVYAIISVGDVVYQIFYALLIVCIGRAVCIWLSNHSGSRQAVARMTASAKSAR